jgi:hypothetical protein
LIAATFGTVTAAMFPGPDLRVRADEALAATGLDTLEIIARLRASDVSTSTLEALRITTDQLCSEYPHQPSDQLRIAGQDWLRRTMPLLEGQTGAAARP